MSGASASALRWTPEASPHLSFAVRVVPLREQNFERNAASIFTPLVIAVGAGLMGMGGWAAGSFVSLVATVVLAGRIVQLINRPITAMRFAVHLFSNGQAQPGRLSWLISVNGGSLYIYSNELASDRATAFPTHSVEAWLDPHVDVLTGAIVASGLQDHLSALRAAPRRKIFAYRLKPTGVSSVEDKEAALDIYSDMVFL